MAELKVHVLMRASKKTGKIDTTMTELGKGMLEMWALNNTPRTKTCLVMEQDTGKIVLATIGTDAGFPRIKKDMGYCYDIGMPLEFLQSIKDDRF